MPIPRDQLPIGEGLAPDGEPGASFFMDRVELETLERDGPESKYEDARFIFEAVKAPDSVFEGLQRPGQEESFAYSVRPTHDPNDEGENLVPPRFGYAFVAFVRTGMGGYIVFDWEWRAEDPDTPGHPLGWQQDFARRTWHKI